MGPSRSSSSCPAFSIASLSLGSCNHHSLPKKLEVTARLGYDSIEIFVPDFDAFVREVSMGAHSELVTSAQLDAAAGSMADLEMLCAEVIGKECRRLGLGVSIFQPFRDFENFDPAGIWTPESGAIPPLLRLALLRAERQIRLLPAMDCSLLLVCSNLLTYNPFHPITASSHVQSTTSYPTQSWEHYRDVQILAFKEIGKLAAKYGVRIGYEPLAWGTAVNTWEQVWEVVEAVDMENVGVILDSFNSLCKQWADPTSVTGRLPLPSSVLTNNLANLAATIPSSKLFFYQIADAQKPETPFPPSSHDTSPARMNWSRASRLFPMEKERGAYLPVEEYTRAVLKTGYQGVWSLEVFNKSLESVGDEVVEEHGRRGISGLRALWAATGGDGSGFERVAGSEMEADVASGSEETAFDGEEVMHPLEAKVARLHDSVALGLATEL